MPGTYSGLRRGREVIQGVARNRGVGKHTAGDSRTPLGTYPLGQPNCSTQDYIAIAVGYLTREQVKRGYTGKDISIKDRRTLARAYRTNAQREAAWMNASPSRG